MRLGELLTDDAEYDRRFAAVAINGVTADSRKVQRGSLFVAVPGTKADGLQYTAAAIAAGAAAIVAERVPAETPEAVAFVRVPNARRALALAAARLHPRQPATIAAVTGTSGKTSVAAFTRQIWQALGHSAASIGTVGIASPRGETYGSLTTPDPVDLHRTLDALAGDGVTHLAMEASSHGLDQHRLDGVRISAGGFTNLSRDHLDYHATFDAYVSAKLRLFQELLAPGSAAVIALDQDEARVFVEAAMQRQLRLITIGGAGSGIRALESVIDGYAQTLTLQHEGRQHRIRLPLVGAFQVQNALVAAGLAIATGSDAGDVFATLEGLKGAKGRLELVGNKNAAPIFVDYAHKPDALAKALEALRPYVRRRLVVVFGCGGDRDRGKRPQMGAIAERLADHAIVTSDNPRTENPDRIIDDIEAGMKAKNHERITDRHDAIARALTIAGPDDVVVLAGKGHETYQIRGTIAYPFDEREIVRELAPDSPIR
jgi:UDP-N-acetylmuramoyl-L-alanyl-D-glutamate--2,6-diaminopimelate ligase